ncbi:metallophosphoesterase [Pseudorhodoferax sp.]|uniref:metallophosphoesterase n=1 Tax=Pseudorhodoferax sp. TaxID=1993553 RepID=UPI002DD6291D|nr:metallophosphoesterase [Pseudorhodoferax sp.]
MKLQLLSDLHLETEAFEPEPAPGADLLVLAGDIDATWQGLERFAGWPVPVLFVPGNHEFDGRAVEHVVPALRGLCTRLGIRLLHRESWLFDAADGQRVRFLGAVRWSDFDVFGARERERSMRAAGYFMRLMASTQHGQPFDADAVRREGLACRAWLEAALAEPAAGRWQQTVVVTHFAPSLKSADPRFGRQPGTASFCNADDDLIPHTDVWLHGHLHCRHDYLVARAGRKPTRVLSQARGLVDKGEAEGLDPGKLIEL